MLKFIKTDTEITIEDIMDEMQVGVNLKAEQSPSAEPVMPAKKAL